MKKLDAVLGMVAEIRNEVREVRALLTERVNVSSIPSDTLSVADFAKEVGRSPDWVYDQMRLRRVRRCPTGKPYQIPRSEVLRLRDAKGGAK